MIKGILLKMVLKASPNDPCLLSGILENSNSQKTISKDQSQLHVGIYVYNFIFYSSDPSQEVLFKNLLQEHIQVDFMGDVDYFLGTAFTWLHHKDGNIVVQLCQSAFTEFTAHLLSVQNANKVPNMTPYRSGFPIDSIPPVDPLDPALNRRRQVYQSIVGCINWLATCTCTDIAPVLTFIASNSNFPHQQHYKAAVHDLKYLTSTNEYGISFHSEPSAKIQAFNHFTHHHNREAYTEATSQSPSKFHQLTSYCDANLGGQFGSAVEYCTPLELFKFRSLSGFIICRSGGPIAWKSIRQNQTALSSC